MYVIEPQPGDKTLKLQYKVQEILGSSYVLDFVTRALEKKEW